MAKRKKKGGAKLLSTYTGRMSASMRSMKVAVTISKSGYGGTKGFQACAFTGSPARSKSGQHRTKSQDSRGACALGKNPRKAIAAALRKAAGNIGGRSGAFAGWE